MDPDQRPICTRCARNHFAIDDPGRPPDPITWHVCAWCGERTAWGMMMPFGGYAPDEADPVPGGYAFPGDRDTRTGPRG